MADLKKLCQTILEDPSTLHLIRAEYPNEEALYSLTSELEVAITPTHLKERLLQWQQGLLPSDLLVDWAMFILMTDCYETPDKDDDFYYDDLWTILAEISSPATDGELTNQTCSKYIKTLSFIE